MPAIEVTEGQVTIKIYKVKHPTSASGYRYKFRYRDAKGEEDYGGSPDLDEAKRQARQVARSLSAGILIADRLRVQDISELLEARKLAKSVDVSLLAAMTEYAEARKLVGSSVAEACRAWVASRPTVKRILLSTAIDEFIASKLAARRKLKTYGPKLAAVLKGIGDLHVDALTTETIQFWYNSIPDPTTANDRLKRLVTLLGWCRRKGYLNRTQPLPTEFLDRLPDADAKIGIIDAEKLTDILEFFRKQHPQYLGAVALAAFTGMRSDEIHGKRTDKGVTRKNVPRQRWDDIKLSSANPHLNVTIAKSGTLSRRFIPIGPAGVEWLKLARKHDPEAEYVCSAGAMERVRELYRDRLRQRFSPQYGTRKEDLDALSARLDREFPENCFRHSRISYRIPEVDFNKHQVADESGNSLAVIVRRYREIVEPREAKRWFNVRPRAM